MVGSTISLYVWRRGMLLIRRRDCRWYSSTRMIRRGNCRTGRGRTGKERNRLGCGNVSRGTWMYDKCTASSMKWPNLCIYRQYGRGRKRMWMVQWMRRWYWKRSRIVSRMEITRRRWAFILWVGRRRPWSTTRMGRSRRTWHLVVTLLEPNGRGGKVKLGWPMRRAVVCHITSCTRRRLWHIYFGGSRNLEVSWSATE